MNIEYEITILRQTRTNIAGFLKPFPLDQLTKIPDGFHNHLLWNAAHVLVTQQLLCYNVAGLPMYLDEDFINRYRKGSEPQSNDVRSDLAIFEKNSLELVNKLEKDYVVNRFGEYQSYPTSYGVTLSSIEDAIRFNNAHEGLHLGYMMALRRAL